MLFRSLDTLARVYLKMRDKKTELNREHNATIAKIESDMARVKSALLEHMKSNGVESVRTEHGTVYRTVRTTYFTSDWDSMNKFILEHQVPDLLEKRIHQTNMKEFLTTHPELLPPGLNANTEYSVGVRRSKNG